MRRRDFTLAAAVALVAAAAVVLGPTARAGDATGSCALAGTAGRAGSVVKVLHSSVFVGGKYVGAAPADVRPGDRICTDAKGQIIVDLGRVDVKTTCNVLPGSSLLAPNPALAFESGSAWCVTRGGTASLRVSMLTLLAFRDTLFSVAIQDGTIVLKVASGSIGGARVIAKGQQLTIAPGGASRLAPLVLAAQDRVAIAQLSTAIAGS